MLRPFISLSITLAATASLATAAQAQARPAGRPCIGVMSTIGDSFYLQKVGITVFGNDLKKVPIGAWGLDDFVIRKAVAAFPDRTVKRLSLARGELAALEAPRTNPFEPRREWRDVIKVAAGKAGCERNIIVSKRNFPIAGTNQHIYGLGMLERAGGTPLANVHIFVATGMSVLDGRTGDVTSSQLVSSVSFGERMLLGDNNIAQRVDTSWWPASGQVVGDTRVRDGIRAMLDRGLTATLKEARGSPAR